MEELLNTEQGPLVGEELGTHMKGALAAGFPENWVKD